jgi:type VI protein secretion system component Hcp
VDSSSPGLMAAVGTGTAIPAATIVVRNGNTGAQDAYLQVVNDAMTDWTGPVLG